MSYKLSATLNGHTQDVRDLVAIDDKRIASVSRDGTLRVWSKLDHANDWEGSILYSDEKFLNAVTHDVENDILYFGGKETVINAKFANSAVDEDPIMTLIGHESNICSLNYDPASKLLVSGSWDKTAKIWRDGQLKWNLQKHEASVWDARVLGTEADPINTKFITASADKSVKVWMNDTLVKSYSGIHDDVIRTVLAIDNGSKFVTASNDCSIKVIDTETGNILTTLNGHESFVYSVIENRKDKDELVSCGEDRSVRVWSLSDGNLNQVIRLPAISIWCIDTLPNGDIIIGSSDKTIRIFTKDESRIASEDQLKKFDELVSNSALNAKAMDFDESKLSPYEILKNPGKKEGQLVVVKSPQTGVIEAHQYSQGAWSKVGDVVSSTAGGNDNKTEFEGHLYDYVFDVDIQEGQPPLKLPVNVNDNPYILADQFIMRYELPSTYKDQIVNFIITNTSGMSLDDTNSSQPQNITTPNEPTFNVTYNVLPVKTFLTISNFNPDTIFNGIVKLNSTQDKKLQFEDELLGEIGAALNDIDNGWELLLSIASRIKNEWTVKLPAFDLMRIIVTKVPEPAYLMEYLKDGLDNPDIRISMLTVRMLANSFENHTWGLNLMGSKDVKESVFETIGTNFPTATVQQAANFALSVSTLIMNYSVLVSQNTNEHLDIVHILSDAINTKFAKLEEYQDSEEASYRLIIAYGNLSLVEPTLKSFASSVSWIKSIKSKYGNIQRFQTIFMDLGINH